MLGSYHIPVIFMSIIIPISFLSTAISVQSISNSDDACTVLNRSVSEKIIPRISISTDTQQYSPGQFVEIFGNVTDSQGKPVNETLNLNILDPSKKSVGGEQTCTLGGKFSYTLKNTQQVGTYTIIVSIKGLAENTTISVLDLFTLAFTSIITSIPLLAIGTSLGFGIVLVIVLIWLPKRVVSEFTKYTPTEEQLAAKKHRWSKVVGPKKPASIAKLLAERSIQQSQSSSSDKKLIVKLGSLDRDDLIKAHRELDEVERNLQWANTWRFICISGMVLSVLAFYFFMPIEVGVNSSLGLVKIHNPNSQWVLNVGGTRETNYTGGLHIPLYVFIFGILGGYLRYLYTTAYPEMESRFKKTDEIPDSTPKRQDIFDEIDRDEKDTNEFLVATLKQLALIFLAPLLAIAVWFVLSGQGQTYTNVSILAALSLVIGLVTKEVVDGLIAFAQGRLPGGGKETPPASRRGSGHVSGADDNSASGKGHGSSGSQASGTDEGNKPVKVGSKTAKTS